MRYREYANDVTFYPVVQGVGEHPQRHAANTMSARGTRKGVPHKQRQPRINIIAKCLGLPPPRFYQVPVNCLAKLLNSSRLVDNFHGPMCVLRLSIIARSSALTCS